MNDFKLEMEVIVEKWMAYWLDLSDAVKEEKWDQVDLLCRQMDADIRVVKELAFEMKRKVKQTIG